MLTVDETVAVALAGTFLKALTRLDVRVIMSDLKFTSRSESWSRSSKPESDGEREGVAPRSTSWGDAMAMWFVSLMPESMASGRGGGRGRRRTVVLVRAMLGLARVFGLCPVGFLSRRTPRTRHNAASRQPRQRDGVYISGKSDVSMTTSFCVFRVRYLWKSSKRIAGSCRVDSVLSD